MPKNKVNNNIKLKSGGGLENDATDGLSVDTTIYPAVPTIMSASDTAVLTANTEKTTTSTAETVLKKFSTQANLLGTVRIKFQKRRGGSNSGSFFWYIRVNEMLVYTTSEGGGSGYSNYTDVSFDINVAKNSYITISASVPTGSSSPMAFVQNASVSYDLVAQPSTAAAVVTN